MNDEELSRKIEEFLEPSPERDETTLGEMFTWPKWATVEEINTDDYLSLRRMWVFLYSGNREWHGPFPRDMVNDLTMTALLIEKLRASQRVEVVFLRKFGVNLTCFDTATIVGEHFGRVVAEAFALAQKLTPAQSPPTR